MINILNGEQVCDGIINSSQKAVKTAAEALLNSTDSQSIALGCAVGNVTNAVIQSSKAVVSVDSGSRVGAGSFKLLKDVSRGDKVCAGLCAVSLLCETTSGVLVWTPIPYKLQIVAALKGTSRGCLTFRDMCAREPSVFC